MTREGQKSYFLFSRIFLKQIIFQIIIAVHEKIIKNKPPGVNTYSLSVS